jgi:hypothetical protein
MLALVIGGCSHSPIYDENRDKQAAQAKKAAEDLKLGDSLAALEKTIADLAALEENRAKERAQLLFDGELRSVVQAPSLGANKDAGDAFNGLLTTIRARMKALLGAEPTAEAIRKIRTIPVTLRERNKSLQLDLTEFEGTTGLRLENCAHVYAGSSNPALKAGNPSEQLLVRVGQANRSLARQKYPALVEACKKIDEVFTETLGVGSGEIKELRDRHAKLSRAVEEFEEKLADAKRDLDGAVEEFKKKGKASEVPSDKSRAEQLEERAKKLEEAVEKLAKGTSKQGQAGAAAVATERLKHLENVLAAVANSSSDKAAALTDDEKASVAFVRGLPALADEADKLLTAARQPRVVPILLAIDHQKLLVQGFEADSAIMNRRLEIVSNQIGSTTHELQSLASIADRLSKKAEWANKSISELRQSLPPAEKVALLEALAIYADDFPRYRVEQAAWHSREMSLEYERGLVQSKNSAAQWDNLIRAIAVVLSDYHASGVKKTDLAEFFKALGLVTIGIGVAQ